MGASRRRGAARIGPDDGERGSAVVEFLGVTLLLLVPLLYLVLVLAQLQAAAFAAEGAAREAGRIVVRSSSLEQARGAAATAVELAFADQGMDVQGAQALQVRCELEPCLSPGGQVHVTVSASITLPLVPDFLRDAVPVAVPVSATHVAVADRFVEAP